LSHLPKQFYRLLHSIHELKRLVFLLMVLLFEH